MTICKECKYFFLQDDEEVWYAARCKHPAYEREEAVDPIFGRKGYIVLNERDRVIYVEEKHPFCSNLNEGNCAGFEAKRKLSVV